MATITPDAAGLLNELLDSSLNNLARDVRDRLEQLEGLPEDSGIAEWAMPFRPRAEEPSDDRALRQIKFIDAAVSFAVDMEWRLLNRNAALADLRADLLGNGGDGDRLSVIVETDRADVDMISLHRRERIAEFKAAWRDVVSLHIEEIRRRRDRGPAPDGTDDGMKP